MSTVTAADQRTLLIQGLRELADFLENPLTPRPPEVSACAYGLDAKAFVELAADPGFCAGRCGNDLFQLKREFTGNVSYRVVIGTEKILPNPPSANVDDILKEARGRL